MLYAPAHAMGEEDFLSIFLCWWCITQASYIYLAVLGLKLYHVSKKGPWKKVDEEKYLTTNSHEILAQKVTPFCVLPSS